MHGHRHGHGEGRGRQGQQGQEPDATRRGHGAPGVRLRHGPPFGRVGFAMGGPRRGRRSRRGDVRVAVLLLLEEQPRNGYQLIQELAERSGGAWRPSPGSIYPVLAQLEDEGLIEPDDSTDGRGYALTDAGRAEVAANRERMGKPWESAAAEMSEPRFALFATARQVAAAVRQVMEAGTDAQVAQAAEVLADARRRIYRILAEDDATSEA